MSNTERPVVEQAKKQSKRLLKLAQKSPLVIKSLSDAQDVVAKLCGYPTWHTLLQSSPLPCTKNLAQNKQLFVSNEHVRWADLQLNTCWVQHNTGFPLEEISAFQTDIPTHRISLYSNSADHLKVQSEFEVLSATQINNAPHVISPLGTPEFDTTTLQMISECIMVSCNIEQGGYIQGLLASSIQDVTRMSYMTTHDQLSCWNDLSSSAQDVLEKSFSRYETVQGWPRDKLDQAQQLLLLHGLENDAWIVHAFRMPFWADIFEKMMGLGVVHSTRSDWNAAVVKITKWILKLSVPQFPTALLAPCVVFHVNGDDASQNALMCKAMLLGHYRETWWKRNKEIPNLSNIYRENYQLRKNQSVLQCFDRVDGLFEYSSEFRNMLSMVVREGRKNGTYNLITFAHHDRGNRPHPDDAFWMFSNWVDN